MMSEWETCEDHEILAEALLEIVEDEIEAIRTLDLKRYTDLAQQRLVVCHHVIELAKEVPVPEEVKAHYQWVHQTTRENMQILQETQQMVRAIIQRLTSTSEAIYRLPGKNKARSGQGMMIWKG
ncbi:MAG: hypothetical protein AAFX99_03750 [Myxococcota bacterium]